MLTKERDTQKNAVYNWEQRRFLKNKVEPMSQEDCTALVTDVCRCYGITVPEMIYRADGHQTEKGTYRPFPLSIILYRWARQRSLILHEVAHHIHHCFGKKGANHGKEYFSIFAYLISEYMSIPLYEIFHKAGQDGIEYDKLNYPKFKDGMTPDPKFVKRYS